MPLLRGSLLLSLILACCAGCGPGSLPVRPAGEEPLRQLVLMLGQYKSTHQGRNPADVAEFKRFVKNFDSAKLELWGIKDPEAIFTSPRDNKPYVLRLHISGAPPSDSTKMPIVAHEQEGVNGKRMVAFLTLEVQEVEEAEFKELLKLK